MTRRFDSAFIKRDHGCREDVPAGSVQAQMSRSGDLVARIATFIALRAHDLPDSSSEDSAVTHRDLITERVKRWAAAIRPDAACAVARANAARVHAARTDANAARAVVDRVSARAERNFAVSRTNTAHTSTALNPGSEARP
jgi:hypothetical protein